MSKFQNKGQPVLAAHMYPYCRDEGCVCKGLGFVNMVVPGQYQDVEEEKNGKKISVKKSITRQEPCNRARRKFFKENPRVIQEIDRKDGVVRYWYPDEEELVPEGQATDSLDRMKQDRGLEQLKDRIMKNLRKQRDIKAKIPEVKAKVDAALVTDKENRRLVEQRIKELDTQYLGSGGKLAEYIRAILTAKETIRKAQEEIQTLEKGMKFVQDLVDKHVAIRNAKAQELEICDEAIAEILRRRKRSSGLLDLEHDLERADKKYRRLVVLLPSNERDAILVEIGKSVDNELVGTGKEEEPLEEQLQSADDLDGMTEDELAMVDDSVEVAQVTAKSVVQSLVI